MSQTGVAGRAGGKTSFTPTQDLQPTTVFYWRARAVQGRDGSVVGGRPFRSKLVGFMRAGELYDPLIHGETVGEHRRHRPRFIPGKGLQLNNGQSFVSYRLPQTITSGEFSMDVEGLRANGPGDKAKVFGMQDGDDDFITNDYRIDIQYRGSAGFRPTRFSGA